MLVHLSRIFVTLMIIMCFVGIVTNFLSLVIYTRKSFRKKSINVLLSALSATDLCVCILAIPVFASTQLAEWIPVPISLTAMIMVYLYPVTIMFQSMSVWLLVSITIDRYLAVCHPFMVNTYCSRNRALLTVGVVVSFSIVYNVVRFWEYRIDFNADPRDLTTMVQPVLRGNPHFMLWYQNVATMSSQFVLPLVVLCVLNLQVARTIIRASEQRRELVASVKREHSTAKMMIMVVIVFLVCYVFSFVLNIAEIIDSTIFNSPFGYFLNDINNVLVVVNSSSAFIFYYTYSTRYRNQARALPGIRWFTSFSKFNMYDTEIGPSRSMTTRYKDCPTPPAQPTLPDYPTL
uniref:G_PROTEIN_RECEP_F1_2 domain-containing protein n=1 Tax=Caenorhabditis japonica TaxID=281687 RepID=A0A8R1I4R7_CAEJA